MLICGIQKLSLLDYPEKLAASIFTGGCNFRCPFCHNAQLVTAVSDVIPISEDEILSFLKSRVGKLDGVCITGGEPLLNIDIDVFIRKIRDLGLLVKLDTNGSYPERLEKLLSEGLLDYVAMDIKNSSAKYAMTVGVEGFDIAPIKKSIALIMSSGIEYEFRTTLVRGFHTENDIEGIGELVRGASKHFLQNFKDSGDLVGFKESESAFKMGDFSTQELGRFTDVLSHYVGYVGIRG